MELNEKQEKGIEFIENGLANLENVKKMGNLALVDMVIDQITNGKKLIEGEDIGDDVFGK